MIISCISKTTTATNREAYVTATPIIKNAPQAQIGHHGRSRYEKLTSQENKEKARKITMAVRFPARSIIQLVPYEQNKSPSAPQISKLVPSNLYDGKKPLGELSSNQQDHQDETIKEESNAKQDKPPNINAKQEKLTEEGTQQGSNPTGIGRTPPAIKRDYCIRMRLR